MVTWQKEKFANALRNVGQKLIRYGQKTQGEYFQLDKGNNLK
jgi:hypothetical protein